MNDPEFDDLIRRAVASDLVAPDRFDEIYARVRRDQDQDRAGWRRYFAGGHWFGYPPPPAQPTLGDRAQAALGGVVAFVVLLGLIVAVAMGVAR